jgi:hypothetical protein
MTTPEDIDAVMERLMEEDEDIVATLKIECTTHDITRAMMGSFPARDIRKSIAVGNMTVKESFTSKDGIRFAI